MVALETAVLPHTISNIPITCTTEAHSRRLYSKVQTIPSLQLSFLQTLNTVNYSFSMDRVQLGALIMLNWVSIWFDDGSPEHVTRSSLDFGDVPTDK